MVDREFICEPPRQSHPVPLDFLRARGLHVHDSHVLLLLSRPYWQNMQVHVYEGPKAAITLPAKELIETEDVFINSAGLVNLGTAKQSDEGEAQD